MSPDQPLIPAEEPGQIHPLGYTHGENCPHAPKHRDGGRHEFPNGLISCAACGFTLREIGDFRPLPDDPPPVEEPPVPTPGFKTVEEFAQLTLEEQNIETYRLLLNMSGRINAVGEMTDWLVQGTEGLFGLAESIKAEGMTPMSMLKMITSGGGKL